MNILRNMLFGLLVLTFAQAYAADPIDINTADKAALMTIKGVGERRAEAIISYREQHGPFRVLEDLLEVEGIGQATLDANRELLTIGAPTARR